MEMLSYQDNDLSFEMKENGFGVCVRGCGCVGACVTNPTRKLGKLNKIGSQEMKTHAYHVLGNGKLFIF